MSIFERFKNDDGDSRPVIQREFCLSSGEKVFFNSRGLIPVILQDERSKEVIHLGYMDPLALNMSLEREIVYLYRRSNGRLEKFGENKNLEYKIKTIKLHTSRRSILMIIALEEDFIPDSSYSHLVFE